MASQDDAAGTSSEARVEQALQLVPRPINRLAEDVVNRVAAGEIIHRPASALKELLENSLDAGSTNIAVTVKDGGNKLLQITDNGCGIRADDLPILCERHTTSKIVTYDDLKSCATFGFRGEALASMTYVSRLAVTTQPHGALHALRAEYKDGALSAPPRPCAGLPGTTVSVEDLFYNIPTRRKALKTASEEYGKVLEVVQRYALLRRDVAFSCRKQGEARSDLHAPVAASRRDRLRAIYGPALAKQALDFSCKLEAVSLDEPQFTLEGLASGPEYGSKKTVLVLFINGRLVDCSPLKRALEAVYAAALPKAERPFIFADVRLPLAHVDVNVHPTKSEVQILFLEEVIQAVQKALEGVLVAANASRTIGGTQQTLMGATAAKRGKGAGLDDGADDGAEDEDGNGGGAESGAAGKGPSATTAKQQRRDNKLVRVDARSQRLESFFIGGVMGPTPAGAAGGRGGGASASGRRSRADMEGGEEAGEFTDGDDTEEGAAAAGGGGGGASAAEALRRGAKLRRRGGTFGGGGANAAGGAGAGGSQEAQVVYDVNESELTSVRELNSEVVEACHQGLSGILKEHIYCGMADGELALLQHRTKLYIVNIPIVSAELFRQLALQRFGRLRPIRVDPPAPLADMLLLALEEEERRGRWGAEDGSKESVAAVIADLLASRAEMLLEYFAIDVDAEGQALRGLPLLLDQHSPEAERIPAFLLSLGKDTESEKECFSDIVRHLGAFYGVRPSLRELAEEADTMSADASANVSADTRSAGVPDGSAAAGPSGSAEETAATGPELVASASDGEKSPGEGAGAGEGVAGAEKDKESRGGRGGGGGGEGGVAPPKSGPIRTEREWVIAQAVLPAARVHLRPPTRFATDNCVMQIASLEQLYRVFERC